MPDKGLPQFDYNKLFRKVRVYSSNSTLSIQSAQESGAKIDYLPARIAQGMFYDKSFFIEYVDDSVYVKKFIEKNNVQKNEFQPLPNLRGTMFHPVAEFRNKPAGTQWKNFDVYPIIEMVNQQPEQSEGEPKKSKRERVEIEPIGNLNLETA